MKCVVRMIGRGSFLIFSLTYLLKALAHNPNSNFEIICLQEIDEDSGILTGIETPLCTHILYTNIILHPKDATLRFRDSWTGFNRIYGERVTAFKARGIKVIIQVYTLDDSLVIDDKRRAIFVKSSVDFLRQHNLDGLHIWWNPSLADSKIGYGKLVQELYQAYKPKGLHLSIALESKSTNDIGNGYNMTALSTSTDCIIVDLINVRDIGENCDNCDATGKMKSTVTHTHTPFIPIQLFSLLRIS